LTNNRKQIPKKTQTELLFRNNMTCCICRDENKGIHIHHIDADRNNNDINNLAVVCTICHDKIQKKGGLTKEFPPDVVKKYKQDWEASIFKKHSEQRGDRKSSIEKILIKHEIKKTLHELIAIDDNNLTEINRLLGYLSSIQILEDPTLELLNEIDYTLPLFAYTDVNKSSRITKTIFDFIGYLDAGPEHIKIDKKDKDALKLVIEIIGDVGDAGALMHSTTVLKSVISDFENIWSILVSYNLEDLALHLLNQLEKIDTSSTTAYEDHTSFSSGIYEITELRHKLRAVIDKQTKWKKVLKKLD
jgi:hypothetical protein